MDYEKKYKEALERARALRNEAIEKEYAVDYIKDYETIFPELRESEDDRIRKWIVNLLHVLHYNQTAQPMALKAIEYLEKQKEQNPAEWSEEDIKKIRSEEYTKGFNDAAFGDKLKEWSEEDERLLTKLMTFVDIDCFDRECNGKDLIDWLKSFRPQPHWKPSEEQMGALKDALETYEGFEEYDAMKSLYNELKKLM